MEKLQGQYVDLFAREIYPAELLWEEGCIKEIRKIEEAPQRFILPGFVDAHVHIESSMLVPTEFARLAVVHGTVATVSDPHEIGNVLGGEGVKYMIADAAKSPFRFFFGAPSCVPATKFETAGASIDSKEIEEMMGWPEIYYLAEMMNWPGVLMRDDEVMAKIAAAHKAGKPVDGHAPGLRGDDAQRYIAAGIATDHECFTIEEALDKLKFGMKILIREGSAAKNFDALVNLFDTHPEQLMFCSDDKHPDNLVLGHINELVVRAVKCGKNVFDVLQAACVNPVLHYQLPVGLLRKNDPADFIVVSDLKDFDIEETYIAGKCVASKGKTKLARLAGTVVNQFELKPLEKSKLAVKAEGKLMRVMEAYDGQLITGERWVTPLIKEGLVATDTDGDVLKMVIVNRYSGDSQPQVAFIHNFGLKEGAIASSVAHDSHNVIAVGVDDEHLVKAINNVINAKGGIAAVSKTEDLLLPLPVAGLMSIEDGYEVAKQYSNIDALAKRMGSTLASPFMTLSFMALLVIPQLKLSDLGLFDGKKFEFCELFKD